MKIIVSGGAGFIGSKLVAALASAGHSVAIWSRGSKGGVPAGVETFVWNPAAGPPPPESLEGMDAVIHLAGENLAHRWTDELKKKIRDSRVLGTRNLVEGIAKAANRPKALICSSATGYYGDRGEEELTESSAPGGGFLAEVCAAWEREADAATKLGVRVVKMRTGMVLGSGGGALEKLVPAFQSRMGGRLGSGKQWVPWVHMTDIVGLYKRAAESDMEGVVNGTAPHPVRNAELTEALGSVLDVATKVAVPEFALKMMFGEMAEVMLASQKVLPVAAQKAGYSFQFAHVAEALREAVKK